MPLLLEPTAHRPPPLVERDGGLSAHSALSSSAEPLRVLHVIPSISLAHGGPSRAIRTMESSLAARGVHVETATTDDDGPGRFLDAPKGVLVREGVAKRWYFHKNSEFYKASWSFSRWIQHEVSRFDVVHIHALFSFTSIVAARAARRKRIPYVIRPLGVLTRYGLERRRPLLKRVSLHLIEGPLLRDAAAVHFTSDAERTEAEELGYAMNSAVIPLGVDKAQAGEAARLLSVIPGSADAFRLLFLSRLDRKKNVEGLITALTILRHRGLRPMLLIAGTGDTAYVDELKALVQFNGISEQVRFLGHVAGNAHADALAAAHLFVLPSFSENFGIAVVEALFAGVPCVLGRGVAVADAIESAGAGLAVAPTPDAIADAIQQYLRNPELLSRASRAAAVIANSEYSVEAMGAGLCNLYASIRSGELRKQA